MEQQKLRLMFTGGGSGGPTTPLLGLAETLKDHQEYSMEFLFLGTSRGPERRMVEEFGMPYQAIPAGKLRRYWDWKNLSDPFLVLVGFFYGVFYLLKFRPQIVISAGSFASVPVAWASMILRVPHLILQMDVRPGLANRLMKPCSNAAAFYFDSTLNTFSGIQKREVVGPVVRSNILNSDPKRAEAEWGLDPEKPLLTVTGGGQGAGQLNRLVEMWLPVWLQNWQVVHLTGKGHTGENKVHRHYYPLEFVEHGMGDLLPIRDLVNTRQGMGILGE
ncbi:MAG: UDP-N-acetylglucosamine--N-acetylmuramyl-(pentapeptide) pyrophosphoryl-undecaprenol N-acetylglucosamine transferase [SAR324 cluster bacterium]|nr:UDP-N-acetylglucosamine--N-acetylmuramyl-(pentapeptide) pyrophosphoryl-undecaprenol N-acetylglucosamine transferase [SAR324 cluster bacterium]